MKLIFGDMGIFVRSDVFKRMNGYAETPLMEDMEFCSRLKQQGDIVILPQRIDTSIRRWEEEGWMKNVVRNWILQAAWKLGVSPERLARWYTFK